MRARMSAPAGRMRVKAIAPKQARTRHRRKFRASRHLEARCHPTTRAASCHLSLPLHRPPRPIGRHPRRCPCRTTQYCIERGRTHHTTHHTTPTPSPTPPHTAAHVPCAPRRAEQPFSDCPAFDIHPLWMLALSLSQGNFTPPCCVFVDNYNFAAHFDTHRMYARYTLKRFSF